MAVCNRTPPFSSRALRSRGYRPVVMETFLTERRDASKASHRTFARDADVRS